MYIFEQHVSVLLEFRAMVTPVEVLVPGYILRYLDTHAERGFAPDGTVIYRHPTTSRLMPDLQVNLPA